MEDEALETALTFAKERSKPELWEPDDIGIIDDIGIHSCQG
jgi:hypothetical protein